MSDEIMTEGEWYDKHGLSLFLIVLFILMLITIAVFAYVGKV